MSLRTGLSNASEVTADVWRVQALAGDAEQEVDSRQSFEDTMPSPVRPIPDLGAGAASSTPFDEQPTMDSVAAFTVTLSALLPITHLTSSKLTRSPLRVEGLLCFTPHHHRPVDCEGFVASKF